MNDVAPPAPDPARSRRHPILLGVFVFAMLFFGDLYLNHGTNLAVTLPASLGIGIWAGYREARRA
ncbi:hypothetical protein ACFZ8E_16620 [Methylobacterium sp. HMF5984]|uniref:hypothetical protein n=1 Tax=Methylobacterium sp. HMF5984 TaxID=3367370 RepID=UPI00385360E3